MTTPLPDVSDIEQQTIKRVTRRMIPFLVLLFVVAFLDRNNVGFADISASTDAGRVKLRLEVFSRKADDLLSAMGRMDARLKTLTADADFGRAVGDAGDLITATQIAKEFGLSAVAFNRLLSSLGIQYKRSGQWLLYARYDGLGYTRTVYTTVIHQDGRRTIALTTKWTPRGRRFLHDFLKRRGVMPGALAAGEPVAVGEEGDRDA